MSFSGQTLFVEYFGFFKEENGVQEQWNLQSTYLNMSFNSLTFLDGYLLAWLSFKKALAYANGPAFT